MRADNLMGLAEALDISTLYSELDYSYASECEFQKSGEGADRRSRFVSKFDICQDDAGVIFRIFNQINYFYAQRAIDVNKFVSPSEFLISSNRILLYAQGKPLGIRTKEIQYGARMDVDFMDIRRRYKVLLGMPRGMINKSLRIWSSAICRCEHRVDVALILMLALIAIHPFSDGNGRMARLTLSWLMHRWRMAPRFMKEDQDGEFLRNGHGLQSTEHKMMEAVGHLCLRHNIIQPGDFEQHTADSGRKMLKALTGNMNAAVRRPGELLGCSSITSILSHFEEHEHVTDEPQSFRCLG